VTITTCTEQAIFNISLWFKQYYFTTNMSLLILQLLW